MDKRTWTSGKGQCWKHKLRVLDLDMMIFKAPQLDKLFKEKREDIKERG